jgi:hypothetical protein
MNLNDHAIQTLIYSKYKKLDQKTIKTMKLNLANINCFHINQNLFPNLEYLSLIGNSLKDINYVKSFVNLFFLDIRKNPVIIYLISNLDNSLSRTFINKPWFIRGHSQ